MILMTLRQSERKILLCSVETHKLILKLIREGKVTGLRADHPDGLYNPSEYFQRLQKNCFLYKRLDLTGYVTETF